MGILLVRPGVTIDRLAIAGATILGAAARQAARVSFDWEVTCVTGGHPPTDPHTRGEAADFSVQPFPNASALIAAHAALTGDLGSAYTVLYEVPERPDDPRLAAIAYVNPEATGPHFHSQIRKGTTTIP